MYTLCTFCFKKKFKLQKTRWDFRHQYTNSFKKYLRFHWLEKDSNLRTNHVEERKQSLLFVAQSLIRKKHISGSNFTFITLMTSNRVRKFTNPYQTNQYLFLIFVFKLAKPMLVITVRRQNSKPWSGWFYNLRGLFASCQWSFDITSAVYCFYL